MKESQIVLLKMFNFHNTNQCVSVAEIIGKFPDGIEDLKELLTTELIQPYNEAVYDLQADVGEQLKPGLKLTKKGADLLMRLQFLF